MVTDIDPESVAAEDVRIYAQHVYLTEIIITKYFDVMSIANNYVMNPCAVTLLPLCVLTSIGTHKILELSTQIKHSNMSQL